MIERVLTIGAFGFNERSFVAALKAAGVDLFVDIRARRGVRGAEYSFVNSARLQASLEAAGIKYIHAKELAPTERVRAVQHREDDASGTAKRQRTRLGDAFVAAYERECLGAFSPKEFSERCLRDSSRPVFFCVEREPEACHRSIVARRLASALSVPVEHLRPD
ncbi:hypothetical protein PHYC_02122 [Phycisphaerales bacterium]|nr:hypothetical protein PHYC_02122 [Phycisphaerales bacterium]